jgi:hypothetical protein
VSNIDNTLSNGLASISDQLRPLRELDRLRDLTTQRTRVEREPADRLENLREALKRPKWTDAGSLAVREEPVRFIGGNYVPSPRPAIQGLEYRAAPFFESARFSEWPVHATEELQVISGRIDLLLDDGGDFAIIDHKSFPGSMEPLTFQEAFIDKFVADKFGEATTHWRKLEDRVHRGVGNPCLVLEHNG